MSRRLCLAIQGYHWEGLGEGSSIVRSDGQRGCILRVTLRSINGKRRASLDAEEQGLPIVSAG